MKIGLYGMPCAGKTTLMEQIKCAKILYGSKTLQELAGKRFSELSEDEKREVRIKYTKYVNSLTDDLIISDGHYSFLENIVFTEADGDLYDVFMYVYCSAATLHKRYEESEKNKKYADCSITLIEEWQMFEIESLRKECHKRNKDFYVISDNETSNCKFLQFLNSVKNGFSSYRLAKNLYIQIQNIFPAPCMLNITDGDKTVIKQDSFKHLIKGNTKVFDGDFYTGYQSFLFETELAEKKLPSKIDTSEIEINPLVFNDIKDDNYVILSSGITELWKEIAHQKGFKNYFATPSISADTKYFIVNILKQNGYTIKAFGDSKNDLYMLQEANEGILVINTKLSRSLLNVCIDNVHLQYDKTPFFLNNENYPKLATNISICKSKSGINGNLLASAHFRLGQMLGKSMSRFYPNRSTALLVLERGGRFFGDGIYTSFGGVFYAINPSKETLPLIMENRVVIVDSVINTGKSILKIIDALKKHNPKIDIIVATNVVQENALRLFKEYKLFAVRQSSNSFVGKKQAVQTDNTGPDTADRLFNKIPSRFKKL